MSQHDVHTFAVPTLKEKEHASTLLTLLMSVPFVYTLSARADVVYDLTLTSTQGHGTSYGSFTLNQAPPATGVVAYFPGGRSGTPGDSLLSFNAYGYTLDSFDNYVQDLEYVEVDNNVFNLFNFVVESGGRAHGFISFRISATGYSYSDSYFDDRGFPQESGDAGTVSITPAVATTPEPSSFALLGTGLLATAAFMRRRLSCLSE